MSLIPTSDNANAVRSSSNDTEDKGEGNVITAEQLIHWIESRRSIGNLSEPGPSHDEILMAIECAVTAPDHKKLQPWRFIVTQGEARGDLGAAFVTAAERQAVQQGEVLKDKTRQKTAKMPLRAPVIITVVTHIQEHYKVPEFEQLLSAGAAVQNLILALQAQGYSSVWRTGLLANEPAVKAYFDVADNDYVVGFIYTGSNERALPDRGQISTDGLIRFEGGASTTDNIDNNS